jgi:hypothetical protein
MPQTTDLSHLAEDAKTLWLPWLVAKYGVEAVAAHHGVSTRDIWEWVDDAEAADLADGA